jgi:hypothetical protein
MNLRVKKASGRDDLQLEEIKNTVTIENYFLLA